LRDALVERSERWADVVKIGRTHLQDAVPLTVGQEWSGYAAQLTAGIDAVEHAMMVVLELAIGGTAVGTGLNAPEGFGPAVAAELSERTGLAFAQAPNLFAALAGAEALVAVSGALRQCATSLFKIGNDLRWLGSGPRAGLGELVLPANEPGSSIMPGKVNPTQCEALLMACVQVMGNDTTVAIAASQGNFELNVMRPVIAANVLRSIELLAATTTDVRVFLVDGVELNQSRIDELLGRSLMLVTALSPAIGYDAAAAIAHDAHERGVSLRDAALASGLISADDFDRIVDPSTMT
jgi:fumarate hydratase class II